jgi:adenylate cyclase
MATDIGTISAFAAHDAAALRAVGQQFEAVYPELDILFFDEAGKLVTQLGCDHPLGNLASYAELAPAMKGTEIRTVTAHGCEASDDAPPAHMIAAPVKGGGAVVVCSPVSSTYLANAGEKFGLELAMVPSGSSTPVATTPGFPKGAVISVLDKSQMIDASPKTWEAIRWEPKTLHAPGDRFAMIAALDVSDIRTVVRWNLAKVALLLFTAVAVSVFLGWRLASVMGEALRRVGAALKKLEHSEYTHVVVVKTGDELEDLATGFNTMVDGLKERDKLRSTMGKYMTQVVMDHLMNGQVALGGASIKVTILFSDIRSFTTISEKMEAQALVGLLNEYFTEMVTAVMSEDGVVDKYIGDAIMAVFGAPVPKPADAVHAVRAAVKMSEALAELNKRLAARGLAPLGTGIGIHTGDVVAGNIGSERRMEYTVIGDAVNLASRLETATKELGVHILISDDTYELTKDHIEARPVKEIHVKGRAKPVMTYEVLGLRKGAPELAASPVVGRAPQPSA